MDIHRLIFPLIVYDLMPTFDCYLLGDIQGFITIWRNVLLAYGTYLWVNLHNRGQGWLLIHYICARHEHVTLFLRGLMDRSQLNHLSMSTHRFGAY